MSTFDGDGQGKILSKAIIPTEDGYVYGCALCMLCHPVVDDYCSCECHNEYAALESARVRRQTLTRRYHVLHVALLIVQNERAARHSFDIGPTERRLLDRQHAISQELLSLQRQYGMVVFDPPAVPLGSQPYRYKGGY